MHVGHLLTRAAQRYPDRPAWLQGDLSISFRGAEDRTNRFANALLNLGAQPGDRVGMLLPNCYQGLETIIAPMKAGMATVPMNIRLHPREHEYLLSDSGASVLVYGQEFRDQVSEIRESLDSVKNFICVGDDPEAILPTSHSWSLPRLEYPSPSSITKMSHGSSTPQARRAGRRAPCSPIATC